MTSSRWKGGGGADKRWSKFRWKWMVTGVEGEGIHRNWMSTTDQYKSY